MFIDVYSMAEQFTSSQNSFVVQNARTLKSTLNNAGTTPGSQNLLIGIYFMEKTSSQTLSTQHPSGYIKNQNDTTQCSFIKESEWWVPTLSANSGSLLDKLFYKVY